MISAPIKDQYIYNKPTDFININDFLNMSNLNNRLLCTFVEPSCIDDILQYIQTKYTILYNKIFVLELSNHPEYVITYNIDHGNVTNIMENTILVHRNKNFNVLYSLNSLNYLIKQENNGVLDKQYSLNWSKYKNSILTIQHNEFHKLDTKIKNIIEI